MFLKEKKLIFLFAIAILVVVALVIVPKNKKIVDVSMKESVTHINIYKGPYTPIESDRVKSQLLAKEDIEKFINDFEKLDYKECYNRNEYKEEVPKGASVKVEFYDSDGNLIEDADYYPGYKLLIVGIYKIYVMKEDITEFFDSYF
jgi:hypothetical protein